jgi:thiamine-phosphate pyrophosphorylase
MRDDFFKLMLVTNKQDKPLGEYLKLVVSCVEAGVTSVQLREKGLSFDALLEFGRELQAVLKQFAVPLIINDSVEIAYRLDADGVHLGQSDGAVLSARQRLGDDKIIGLTVETIEQVNIANSSPIAYIGLSAIFPSKNKANIKTIWGCDGLEKVAKLSKVPVVAIGGINEANVEEVIMAGAHGIAAIGAFHDIEPALTTKNLYKLINGITHDNRTNFRDLKVAQ